MNFVQNILWNSVEGFVEAGTRSVGQYAGDALIKAGDVIENTGRGVGDKLERSASAYGQKISGQGYQGGSSGKALPSTALKPAVKRSNSMPATSKVHARKDAPRGRATAVKQIANGAGATAAKSMAGGAQKQKAIGGSQKTGTTPAKALSKPAPANVPSATGRKPATTTPNQSAMKPGAPKNHLPKPYPNPSSTPAYSTEKKTPVKPGKPKPFVVENKALDGTFGKKTPVKPKKYGPTAEKGKVQHIPLSGIGTGGSQKSTGAKTGGAGAGGKMQHIPIGDFGSSSTYGGSAKGSLDKAGGKMQHIPVV